nr:hypothetical protein [Tanacetum cinerariifolium]
MIVVQQADEGAAEVNVNDVPAAGVADEGAADVNANVVLTTVDEPSIPSPPPTTQPPPPSQDVPSTSQVKPTPPPSPIVQQPSHQQQPQPLQNAEILMDLLHNLLDTCTTLTRRVENLEQDKIAQALEITKLKQRVNKLERRNKLKGRIKASMDVDVDVTLKDVVDITKEVDVDAEIEESADSQLQEVVEVVTTAKLITEVVSAASATITVAAPTLTTAAAPTLTTAPSAARRRKGVVIRDPKETATPSTIIHTESKSKDKGKGILVEEPKPLKKQAQIEQDEAFAREDPEETATPSTIIHTEAKSKDKGKGILDDVIDQVQRKEKEDNVVMRYQALKRKPQTEAQARKNMMIYLRNMAGFKMDYFKGMKYDDIRPIFKKYFNSIVASLEKTREQMKEEDNKALKRIMPNDEDDVYTEATPLARKVPVVDYIIHIENIKPYFKIIRADGTHQLFLSFLRFLRNFNREDLEVLWDLVKERFASSKPKNFSNDFLLTTLTYMFEKPDIQAQVWKNQRIIHGLAKVKSWRLLESCGVHIITFTSTHMILLVERRYPLTIFGVDAAKDFKKNMLSD